MLVWTLDKFVQPAHAARVFEKFYGLSALGPMAFVLLGGPELVLIVALVLGVAKRLTSGAVLAFHTVVVIRHCTTTVPDIDAPWIVQR